MTLVVPANTATVLLFCVGSPPSGVTRTKPESAGIVKTIFVAAVVDPHSISHSTDAVWLLHRKRCTMSIWSVAATAVCTVVPAVAVAEICMGSPSVDADKCPIVAMTLPSSHDWDENCYLPTLRFLPISQHLK